MPVWNPNAIIDIRSEADIEAIEAVGFDALTSANSVYEILAIQAEERPDDPAVVFIPTGDPEGPALRLTFAQLFARVTQAANLFAELSGDAKPVVGVLLPSLPQAHIALWGAAAAGIAVPVNFLLGVEPLAELFTKAGVTVLVALGPHPVVDIWSKAQALAERVPTLKALVQVTGEAAEGVVDFDRAVAAQPADALRVAREFARDDVVAYFHTGGTTGAPKLATHSNRNHLAMAFGVGRSWGFEPGEGVMNGLPIFHVGGALCAGLAPLAWGAFMLLVTPAGLRNPEVIRNIWKLTEKHRLAAIGGVPTSIVAMQQVPLDGADISSVKIAITGGSPTPPGPAEAFEARFGVGIHQVYGMTETAGNAVVGPRHAPRVAGSAGLRTPFTELRTVRLGANGPTGESCEPGEPGLLLVRGPTTTPGYTDPERDAEVLLADGWLATGDIARIDPDGRVWVTGRSKDIIIRSGHNLDPRAIEDVAVAHPEVLLAAAVGMPDEYAGELPALFVTLAEGSALTGEALRAWLEPRIPERPALPKVVHVLPQLPLTPLGKVYKPALRERVTRDVVLDRLGDLAADCALSFAGGEVVVVLRGADADALERAAERLAAFTFTSRVQSA